MNIRIWLISVLLIKQGTATLNNLLSSQWLKTLDSNFTFIWTANQEVHIHFPIKDSIGSFSNAYSIFFISLLLGLLGSYTCKNIENSKECINFHTNTDRGTKLQSCAAANWNWDIRWPSVNERALGDPPVRSLIVTASKSMARTCSPA